MKKYLYIAFAAMCLTCCTQEDTIDEKSESNNNVITVALKMKGDISTSETPITRADTESRDLIGIAVYKGTTPFAFGIFDNLDDVSINLIAGSNYRFKCTMIKDAKDKLWFLSDDETATQRFCCTFPFAIIRDSFVQRGTHYIYHIKGLLCNGGFLYRNDKTIDFLDHNAVSLSKASYYENLTYSTRPSETIGAQIERFYGEINGYTPTVDGVVEFDMKRVSFGLKLKVTGIPDGNVDVTYNGITETGISNDFEGQTMMFSMANIYDAWQYANNDYQEQIQVSVVWHRTLVNVDQDLGTKTVNVKRNAVNIIHLKLNSNDGSRSFGVSEEVEEMGEEEAQVSSSSQ